jgi:hypothetical protein
VSARELVPDDVRGASVRSVSSPEVGFIRLSSRWFLRRDAAVSNGVRRRKRPQANVNDAGRRFVAGMAGASYVRWEGSDALIARPTLMHSVATTGHDDRVSHYSALPKMSGSWSRVPFVCESREMTN